MDALDNATNLASLDEKATNQTASQTPLCEVSYGSIFFIVACCMVWWLCCICSSWADNQLKTELERGPSPSVRRDPRADV